MATSADIKAGKAAVEVIAELGPFRKGLQAASDMLKGWGESITSMGKKLAASGAIFSAPFLAAAKAFEAHAMATGAALSPNQLQALGRYLIAQQQLAEAAKKAYLELGAAFYSSIINAGSAAAPVILKIVSALTNALNFTAAWIKENQKLVETIATVALGVAGVGALLMVAGSAITALGVGLGAAAAAAGVLLSPTVLISAAVLGIGGYLLHASGALAVMGQIAGQVFGYIGEALTAIVNAIGAGEMQAAWNVVVTGMQAVWGVAVNWMKFLWVSAQMEVGSIGIKTAVSMMAIWEELGHTIQRVMAQAMAYANTALSGMLDGLKGLLSGMEQAGILKQEGGKIFGIDMNRNYTIDAAMQNAAAFAPDQKATDRAKARQEFQDIWIEEMKKSLSGGLDASSLIPGNIDAVQKYQAALGLANGFNLKFEGLQMQGMAMGQIARGEAVGTFSSSALGQIGASSIDKEIADSSKKTAKATEGILKTILANGLGGIDLA
ncbi:MAG: hypothetical protein U0905_01825 [Pirellulales bacterium]